jgi:SAM-dependent methyltransferase
MITTAKWQLEREAAEHYQEVLVPAILGPAANVLVEWSRLKRGETVLDVGTSTGAAARLAAKSVGASGRVIGVDRNAAMIEAAKSLPASGGAAIEWVEKSIYELPLIDKSVDAAICAQTLQFLKYRLLALSEIRRVLKPEGRIALSLWRPMQENPYFHALVEAIAKHIDAGTAEGLNAAFSLSGGDEVTALLKDAGYQKIKLADRQIDLDLPALASFIPGYIHTTPMWEGFRTATPKMQKAVVQGVTRRLKSYVVDSQVRVPFHILLVLGKK